MGYTGTRLVLVYRSSTGLQGTGLVHGYRCSRGLHGYTNCTSVETGYRYRTVVLV